MLIALCARKDPRCAANKVVRLGPRFAEPYLSGNVWLLLIELNFSRKQRENGEREGRNLQFLFAKCSPFFSLFPPVRSSAEKWTLSSRIISSFDDVPHLIKRFCSQFLIEFAVINHHWIMQHNKSNQRISHATNCSRFGKRSTYEAGAP